MSTQHPPKQWLRIVVATFYVILPLSVTALAATDTPSEPYLIPDQPEPYEAVEFKYVEITHSREPQYERAVLLSLTSTVAATPSEEAIEPVLVPEPEVEPEPEPVEESVGEPAAVEQPTEPEPEPPSHSSGVEQWRGLVEAYFPASEVEYALCIMSHESGGDPGATNGSSGAAGLFQFIPSTWANMVPDELAGDVYDPETNVRAAAWLLGAAGWSQWNPHNRGAC